MIPALSIIFIVIGVLAFISFVIGIVLLEVTYKGNPIPWWVNLLLWGGLVLFGVSCIIVAVSIGHYMINSKKKKKMEQLSPQQQQAQQAQQAQQQQQLLYSQQQSSYASQQQPPYASQQQSSYGSQQPSQQSMYSSYIYEE